MTQTLIVMFFMGVFFYIGTEIVGIIQRRFDEKFRPEVYMKKSMEDIMEDIKYNVDYINDRFEALYRDINKNK